MQELCNVVITFYFANDQLPIKRMGRLKSLLLEFKKRTTLLCLYVNVTRRPINEND
jgi:hypothetical protein